VAIPRSIQFQLFVSGIKSWSKQLTIRGDTTLDRVAGYLTSQFA
jgi:hypothetical protein